ncbi:MAG TPA: hypothetical protein VJ372_08365, partial [Pyrinomonadaceae bacterium]|nr:hypothetical protein [Pyrinomonadaceae bacterium]
MKKINIEFSKPSTRRRLTRRSKRPALFTLILIVSVVGLAVGSTLMTGRISASRLDQTSSASQEITSEVRQQIQALEDEKESRTPAQQKIDSQLLYALKMERSELIAAAVNSLQVNVNSAAGRVVVDITAEVDDQFLKFLGRNGADVLSSSAEYRSVR